MGSGAVASWARPSHPARAAARALLGPALDLALLARSQVRPPELRKRPSGVVIPGYDERRPASAVLAPWYEHRYGSLV